MLILGLNLITVLLKYNVLYYSNERLLEKIKIAIYRNDIRSEGTGELLHFKKSSYGVSKRFVKTFF